MLKHERIFKQTDGSRMKIVISFFGITTQDTSRYNVRVYLCEPGKRTWSDVAGSEHPGFGRMSVTEQRRVNLQKCLEFAGEDKIMEVANELWQQMKPQLDANFHGSQEVK